MTVGELKRRLAGIPDDTVVVKFFKRPERDEGYEECYFLMGTHEVHPDALKSSDGAYLRKNRERRIKGVSKPDFLVRDASSGAKPVPFLVIT